MEPPQKFLIAGMGRIGDLVLMTPLFRALKEDNPKHQVHLLASHINHEVVKPHPYLDKIYVESFQILKNISLIYRLRQEHYDWWIDPKDHRSGTSRYYLRMTHPRESIGFNQGNFQRFTYGIKSAEQNGDLHMVPRFLQSLEPLGIRSKDDRPVLQVSPVNKKNVDKFCQTHSLKGYYFVNVSSSLPQREWPVDKWVELLKSLQKEISGFLICCAPKDILKARSLESQVENARYYSTVSIKDVTAAVSGAEMVFTVDTAIVHIAAAFNKPLLGLYINIPREYSKYYPMSDHAKCIFVEDENALVDQIPVERVLAEYRDLRKMTG